ncbi:MAG TPA: GNAT family N-acetyltransferase [Anaerolineales bacterium]|nr:GNAT family N-acetyltransferase [Anaerolineales bacterium]HRK88548.1 GNAT family N-acetyltransferase [Anaerolineales bacterium]
MSVNFAYKSGYNLRVLASHEVDDSLTAAWSALEARALEANAFLSPYFVLPAIRYLEADKHPLFLFVEKEIDGSKDLVGVAIFNVCKPTRKFPLSHLSLFNTIHSYLSGFLVDREYAHDVLENIYRFIMDPKHGWHGLRVRNLAADGGLSPLRTEVESVLGINWLPSNTWQRPVCCPQGAFAAEQTISKKLLKDVHRRQRGLSALGAVEWQVHFGAGLQERHLDDLLQLENQGWKKDEGTSLLSDHNHTRFFREMAHGFNREKRFFITELRLNDLVLSSASNLISGNSGFGFKLGWDLNYARYSPSILNLMNYLENSSSLPDQIDFLDSSAAPNSYMEEIWQGRRSLSDGMFAFTSAGKLVLSAGQVVKKVKGVLGRSKES